MKTFFKKHIIEFISAIGAVLAPLAPLFAAFFVVILIDLIFGIYAAKKAGEKITSRKMSATISKILLYFLTIIAVYVAQQYIILPYVGFYIPLLPCVVLILCMVEIKSIAEKFQKATGVSLWFKLKKLFTRKLDNLIDGQEKEKPNI